MKMKDDRLPRMMLLAELHNGVLSPGGARKSWRSCVLDYLTKCNHQLNRNLRFNMESKNWVLLYKDEATWDKLVEAGAKHLMKAWH